MNSTLRKVALATTVAAVTALTMTACGGDKTESTASKTTAKAATSTTTAATTTAATTTKPATAGATTTAAGAAGATTPAGGMLDPKKLDEASLTTAFKNAGVKSPEKAAKEVKEYGDKGAYTDANAMKKTLNKELVKYGFTEADVNKIVALFKF